MGVMCLTILLAMQGLMTYADAQLGHYGGYGTTAGGYGYAGLHEPAAMDPWMLNPASGNRRMMLDDPSAGAYGTYGGFGYGHYGATQGARKLQETMPSSPGGYGGYGQYGGYGHRQALELSNNLNAAFKLVSKRRSTLARRHAAHN